MKGIVLALFSSLILLGSYTVIQANTNYIPQKSSIVFVEQNTGEETLFTFGDEKVSKEEFIYVYEKHNAQDPNKYTEKSVNDYLELYVNFKLKVREAETLGLQNDPKISAQLQQYRKQLAQSYLFDKEVTDKLIKEAYDRMNKEVSTSHILIMVGEDAAPQDTVVAHGKIKKLRELIVGGEDFTTLAKKHSQDPSVKDNGGDLGYITAFQTVYPFESAAYNTPKGEISPIIRTKYGYHIVKVDDVREAQGKVEVAHIFVKSSEKDSPALKENAERKIKNIAQQIKEGKKFDNLVKGVSEDKTTSSKGGLLPKFGSGRMLPEFENAAFALEKAGDVSAPVKTKIGWHILKLVNREKVGTYEDMEAQIKKKVDKDSRSQVSKKVFINRLKDAYKFEENADAKKAVKSLMDARILKGKWTVNAEKSKGLNDDMFSLTLPNKEKETYNQADFIQFIAKNQMKARSKTIDATYNKLYSDFIEKNLLITEERFLDQKHPEFGKLMKEFRDGTLLFELTEKNVWNKALQDSTGLKSYFENNQSKYQWAERAEATILTCMDMEIAEKTKPLINKKKVDWDKVVERINAIGVTSNNITLKKGLYEKGQDSYVDQVQWEKGGVSDYISNPDGTVSLVKITDIVEPSPKALNEVRGYVVADYQNQLEKQWIGELREKYPVKVNDNILKTIYKK